MIKRVLFFFLLIINISCSFRIFNNDIIFDDLNENFIQAKKYYNNENYEDIIRWTKEIKNIFIKRGNSLDFCVYLNKLAYLENERRIKSILYFVISDLYWQIDKKETSVYYIRKIAPEDYIVEYDYKPIGYIISKRVISTDTPYKLKENFYNLLINKYNEFIDSQYTLYELLNLYKNNFEQDKALSTMESIVKNHRPQNQYENFNITDIKNDISFYKSSKTWVYQNLETLINQIKEAIRNKNQSLLYRYISRSNFEIKIFQKEAPQYWTFAELGISRRWNNRITFADKLEDFSWKNEVYLKSDNWIFPQMHTWYFYFRKIEYPFDNNVNGGWEWAGIYFGYPY